MKDAAAEQKHSCDILALIVLIKNLSDTLMQWIMNKENGIVFLSFRFFPPSNVALF